MKLRKNDIKLGHLKDSLLKEVDETNSQSYLEGYQTFLNIFFAEVDSMSDIFPNPLDGSHDIDLRYAFEFTYDLISKIQHSDFWDGVRQASFDSEMILRFAYEVKPENQVA